MNPGTNDGSATLSRKGGRGPKIERVAERYGLPTLGDELVERWSRGPGERESLRSLAEDVNKRIIESALYDAGVRTIDGEIDNYYRILTSEDVTEGTRTEVRNSLKAEGVDVEQLEADIISYQSVYNYLVDHRDVTQSTDTATASPDNDLQTIRKLRGRVETVVTDIVDKLVHRNVFSLGSHEVSVDIRVTCVDCNRRLSLTQLFSERQCNCGGSV